MESDTDVSRQTIYPQGTGLFICAKCGGRHSRFKKRGWGQAYCAACHAEYMRANRVRHSDLNPLQRKKANARSYANVSKQRGLIEQKPCEQCSDPHAQMHHDDYDKPTEVRWLCVRCHRQHHRAEHAAVSPA